jgi:glycosyltransferase involved in cell wall biosynthesis
MKIAVNTRFLLKNQLEGYGWFTYEILKRMVAAHPDDEFYFFFDRPYDARFVFAANVKPIVLFPPARHPFLFIWWFEWSVAQALKRIQADVFLSTDSFCTLRTTVPTCLVVHDIAWATGERRVKGLEQWYYETFAPRFFQKATQIITVSEFVKQDLLQKFDTITPEKIKVCYNGCRSEFKPCTATEKARIKAQYTEGGDFFIFVGAVHPRKNVHRLIAAFDAFKTATGLAHKLLIVGRFAWQTGDVKTHFDKAKHQKDILFTGYVPDEDLPLLVAAATAVTYVSLSEGFGIPILEGLNCDVPVLTSTTSSMPEVAGDAALLVNPESIDAIKTALIRLATDTALRHDLIEKGRIQRQKFSWDKSAETLYGQLVSMHK